VTFPKDDGKPGQPATLRVQGTADGRTFDLSQDVTLP